ncbi:MAG: hypothetical protein LBM95_03125 [Lactobacillales bacterium]|jgi:hypothetical protein|nr:hypothetical protein [Lactobacillales bacterium]
MKKYSAKFIATMGLLIAISVVLTRFFALENTFIRISFSFVASMLIGD